MELFEEIKSFKKHLHYLKGQIAAFINKYNTERLHSALYYLRPEDFLFGRVNEKLNKRNVKLEQAKLNRYEVRNDS